MPKKGRVRPATRRKRVRVPSASSRRKAAPKKRRRARPSISRRIVETEKAITTLGARNVRRGSHSLGETGKLTPTSKGFASVRRVIGTVNKVSRVGKKRTFSYDIEGSYIGADGKRHKFSRSGVGIPRLKDVKPRKGESKAAALSRTVETRIRREIHGIIRDKLGGYVVPKTFEGKKITKAQARRELSKLKKSRGVSFKIRFRREL